MITPLPTVALVLGLAGSVLVTKPGAQAPSPPAGEPCAAVTAVVLVCGQQGPEDLYALPGGQWVVASAMAGSGGLNLIRVADRSSTRLYPSATAAHRYDATRYPGCPGPPLAGPDSRFTTHGLWLEPGDGPTRRLLVVGHGSRESIEVFVLESGAGAPALTWVGCVVAPDPIGLNSVVGLQDGGLIASNFLARGITPSQRQRMVAGEANGELWEWHAAGGWRKVPGSDAAGANGLAISDDGRWLYVAAWGSQSFFRLSRGQTPPERTEISLGFRVDNLHRAGDGSLLAAGQGQGTSDVVRIDPKTLAVTRVRQRRDDAAFRGGTVAAEVGDRLWVGSYAGDRIAVLEPRD